MFTISYDNGKYNIKQYDEDGNFVKVVYSFSEYVEYKENDSYYFVKENAYDPYYTMLTIKDDTFQVSDQLFDSVGESINGFRIVTKYNETIKYKYFFNESNGKLSEAFAEAYPYVNGKAIVRKPNFVKKLIAKLFKNPDGVYQAMDTNFNVLENANINGFAKFFYATGDKNFQVIQHKKDSRFYFIDRNGNVGPECYSIQLISDIDMLEYKKDENSDISYLDCMGNVNDNYKYGKTLYEYKTKAIKLEDIPKNYFLKKNFRDSIIAFFKENYYNLIDYKTEHNESYSLEEDKKIIQEFIDYINECVRSSKSQILKDRLEVKKRQTKAARAKNNFDQIVTPPHKTK